MAKTYAIGVFISCCLLVVPSCLSARMMHSAKAAQRNDGAVSGSCDVKKVSNVCKCNNKAGVWPFNFYQCSECKDKMKWGYGCDLDCPMECGARGCDFSGNCVPDPNAKAPVTNCKRNARMKNKPSKTLTNERNECNACDDDMFGLMCDSKCPGNCLDTAEGMCTRGGHCYQCEVGFYGEDCRLHCPTACPSCVMQDGLIPDEDTGEFLPAGFCTSQCETNSWGPSCQKPCPKNCKNYKGPSCGKDTGFCKKCQDHKWFGDECDQPCSKGCEGGTCQKGTGQCERGCKPGLWGDRCEKECPEGTVGSCDRENGKPQKCKKASYPGLSEEKEIGFVGVCFTCPSGCKNGHCNQDGTCSEGCILGKFGPTCAQKCPLTCDGPCDAGESREDGDCQACQVGYTGSKCHKFCHKTCLACTQHGNAIGADDCVSCPADQPTKLEGSTCNCIDGASRKTPTDPCTCDDPADPNKDAFFELTPVKRCRPVCKEGTREVLGEKQSMCMVHKKYKAVIHAEMDGFNQGKCDDNAYEIPIKGEESECIRKDFVLNIVQV